MHAHAHAPGGEFMYVPSGAGRVWIEGLLVPLRRGTSVYVPPGLLHNAENPHRRDLVVVGVTSPGVVPGSYPDVPPLFQPSGRVESIESFVCPERREMSPSAATLVRLDPDPPGEIAVGIYRLDLAAGASVQQAAAAARAFIITDGSALVLDSRGRSAKLRRFDTLLVPAGEACSITAGAARLRLLEARFPTPLG